MKTLTKKKHFLLLGAGVLSLAVAGSVGAISASAAEDKTLSKDGTTATTVDIEYSANDTWTVTIPGEITVGQAAHIQASNVNIADGSTLSVTLKGKDESGWKLTEDQGTKTIDYTVKKGASQDTQETVVNVNGSILDVTAGQNSGESYIKVEVEGNKSTGGKTYKDTLTFTADVK